MEDLAMYHENLILQHFNGVVPDTTPSNKPGQMPTNSPVELSPSILAYDELVGGTLHAWAETTSSLQIPEIDEQLSHNEGKACSSREPKAICYLGNPCRGSFCLPTGHSYTSDKMSQT
jgi:hypothetical protein